jgi:hypothetical protein
MKNIAFVFLTVLLCTAPALRAQQIADVRTMNNGRVVTSVIVGRDTFSPDQPTGVPQNAISRARGDFHLHFGRPGVGSADDQCAANFWNLLYHGYSRKLLGHIRIHCILINQKPGMVPAAPGFS